jgi:hypothetical protein
MELTRMDGDWDMQGSATGAGKRRIAGNAVF